MAKTGLVSAVMDFFLWLVRPRGAFERARAAPGSPSTAAAGMDGSDGRADGLPWL